MTISESIDVQQKCASFSKSRERSCLAYGRYKCRSAHCAHRSCGLHVIRTDEGISCPQCGGPVAARKV
jgi:predicted nucleic acid-binding Zn ribbon protein